MEDTSRGDRYENLSPKEYLNMIRPYLRDLINDHKPTTEEGNNGDTRRGEWKIQLVMQNNRISTKNFEAINNLFDTLLQRFPQAIETSNDQGSKFTHESVSLLYYYCQRLDTRTAESYIESPDK